MRHRETHRVNPYVQTVEKEEVVNKFAVQEHEPLRTYGERDEFCKNLFGTGVVPNLRQADLLDRFRRIQDEAHSSDTRTPSDTDVVRWEPPAGLSYIEMVCNGEEARAEIVIARITKDTTYEEFQDIVVTILDELDNQRRRMFGSK